MESIKLPPNLKCIRDRAFMGCDSLVSLNVPASVVYVGERAFDGCAKLSNFAFPPHLKTSIKRFGNNVFNGCTLLPDAVKGGWGVHLNPEDLAHFGSTVPAGAFHYRRDIKTVVFPNNVVAIGDEAFLACVNLIRVVLPPQLQIIGESAFGSCASLPSMHFPGEHVRTSHR